MRRYLSWIAALFLVPVCLLAASAQAPMLLPVHPVPLVIETSSGERPFFVEVALKPDEHSRGLMFRTEMPDNRGMLFVFSQNRPRSFWMKNTPLPLDLVFIGEDGLVAAIEQGEPFSEAAIAPSVNARFVLELKAGTAAASGIEIGDRVRHPSVDTATADDRAKM